MAWEVEYTYETYIRRTDRLYDEHLKALKREGLI